MSSVLADIHELMGQVTEPRARLDGLLRGVFQDDPNRDRIDGLLDFALTGAVPAWDQLAVTPEDAPVLRGFRALEHEVEHTPGRHTVRRAPAIRRIGPDLDGLAAVRPEAPSLLGAVNAVANLAISPRRTAAVVTSARDEGLCLLEWVAHYRVLGFDHLFVYTNDNIDGSEELLAALAEHGVITLVVNEMGPGVAPQLKCYNHAVHLLRDLRDFEWVLFADADELLMLHPRFGHSVGTYLREAVDVVGPALSAICFHWRWFGSSRAFARDEGLMLERFQQGHANRHVKSLVRLRDVLSMHHLHVPSLPSGRVAVTSAFQPVELHPELPVDYAGGQLNHYWNKSFEEFVFKRMRGDGSLDETARQKDFDKFFVWGQAERPNEPPPAAVVSGVKREIRALLDLPRVRDAAHRVERRFEQQLAEYNRQFGLRQLYESYMRRYA